ncbi:glycoside hydrolase family 65 protein [Nocardiopsis valliformis]|uniref:glycoside hydrolase family 65 protein n=1 Tax=Nocardiopsis valliformis TaxID=239974 RepID=UPI00034D1B2E|nr:glycosyl hydrolase family 65 protein [Nocardiopsis valliformis]
MSAWTLVHEGFDPEEEGRREALRTLGNGYFATRGAAPEARADGVHYPGTYVTGCYNRLVSRVDGRAVENEDLVNAPDWLSLTFHLPSSPWLVGGDPRVRDQRTELDMLRGLLTRTFVVTEDDGRSTRVCQRSLVSMADPHLAAIETTFLPRNWSGTLTVRSGLDARVTNDGVARYRQLDGHHLRAHGSGGATPDLTWLLVRTSASDITLAMAARTRVAQGPAPASGRVETHDDLVTADLGIELTRGAGVTVTTTVALHTSRDTAVSDPLTATRERVGSAPGFEQLRTEHALAWRHLWNRCSVDVGDEDDQRVLNLHLFHLLQVLSPHIVDLDAGAPARGLHGEAYRGHVFWDEVFVFPLLDLHFPETARALLRHRWRRLPKARAAAREEGLRGALFPWQSGSDGREETQRAHLNPMSGRWLPDHSHLQRHVNVAIAYNVWQHHQVTGDPGFLADFGAELLLETARALADLAVYDPELGRHVIRGVMGPDEYHQGYPDRADPGLDDNAYTNVMTAWVLLRALDALEALPRARRRELVAEIGLDEEEVERFTVLTRTLRVPFHDGVISQFAGYEDLAELDWAGLRAEYGDIRRLDRILESRGDNCDRYKAAKQADVLMLFYLLSAEELGDILRRLGYPVDPELIPRTVAYYLERTSHGSTLSSVVHSWVLARTDREHSWRFLREALRSDIDDTQNGTTAEGVHLGAMAGTVDLLTRCYTGLSTCDCVLDLSPMLPEEISELSFDLRYRGHWGVRLRVLRDRVEVAVPPSSLPPLEVRVKSRTATVYPGTSCSLPIR